MYIGRLSAKTQGLRKAFINSQENDRHYNIKSLRTIDKDLARKYTDARYYGGSLKDFWNKAKKFGKRILNSAVETTKNMYKGPKMLISAIAKSDTAKKVIEGVGNTVGKAVGVPSLGTIINTGITSADNITDTIEKIIKAIKDKNPQLAIQDIKKVITDVKNTTEQITKQTDLPQEQKDKVLNNVNKIYNKLPDVIKEKGLNEVEKAAGYLPILDINTLKQEMKEKKGKAGGMVPHWKIQKPIIIRKYPNIFKRLPNYNPKVVASVAAGIYAASQQVPGGRMSMSGESKPQDMKIIDNNVKIQNNPESGRMTLRGTGGESDLMKKLKAKIGK